MNKFLLSLFLVLTTFAASSQKVFFVYIQSEQDESFFVKMNERIYPSTSAGYLIIPNLRDSVYTFNLGFTGAKFPEQRFTVTMAHNDHGYLLKNFGEKGWGLFDLQTLAIQMGKPGAGSVSGIKMEKGDVSAFTDILARAADDSTLRDRVVKMEEKKPVVEPVAAVLITEQKPEEKKTETVSVPQEKTIPINPVIEKPVSDGIVSTGKPEETVKVEVKTEQKHEAAETKDNIPVKEEPVVVAETKTETPVYKVSEVKKNEVITTAEGLNVSFTDKNPDGTADTIKILIPNPQVMAGKVVETPKEERKFLDIVAEPAVKKDTVAAVNPVVEDRKPDVITEVKTVEKANPKVGVDPVVSTPVKTTRKNECREVANDADFLKLRKRMASETDDDDMVDEARKYFKTKCFTTAQLKNLGALFLDDLGKYKFFDMAYMFVFDIASFASLESELKNEYYVNRFRAMLK